MNPVEVIIIKTCEILEGCIVKFYFIVPCSDYHFTKGRVVRFINWLLPNLICIRHQVQVELERRRGSTFCDRVATKIFEDFREALNKAFIIGREPVLIIHYTRPGTCINRPLH